MNKKGQVTVEFVIALSILFILFLFAAYTYSEKTSGLIFAEENYEAERIANELALTVNKIYLAGNGSTKTIFLDSKGRVFDVNVSSNNIEVYWRNNFVDAPTITSNIQATQFQADGKITIRNMEGVVVIE